MKAMGLLSLLGGGGKPSDEEMQNRYKKMEESYINRQGGMPDSPVPGASQVSYQSNSDYSIGDVAPTIRNDKNGNRYIPDPHGAGNYKFNERAGAWMAPGGKTIMLTEATAPPAAPSGGQPAAPVNEDWRKSIRPPVTQPSDPVNTSGQMGDTYDNMMSWSPISSDGQGGVQNMNPLADPNNWLHNTPPQHQAVPNPGTYVNNGIYGMLEQPAIQNKKRNPYSMIG
jgi:hypothetical protein